MKQKRDMNRVGRIALGFIFLAFLSIFLFLFNAASQQVVEVPSLPSIPNQGEIKYYGYKYANYSNIIISAPAAISCVWKPDEIDDGWKECEAIFEVENQNNIKPVLSVPVLNVTFANTTMRNLILNFSSNFSLYNYTYVNISEISPGNFTEEIIQFSKRNFSNFTVVPSSINTSLPFAIRVTYEAPKYQGNFFNFSANAAGFSAFIDPDQSSCGTLSTANSVFTLTSDVSAAGGCFTISGQNITLIGNATGRSRLITYNTGAGGGTGIDINADNFTLRNITITASSSVGTVISLDIAANLKATVFNSNLTAGRGTDNILYMSGENSSAYVYDSVSGSGESSGTDYDIYFVRNNSNVTYVNTTLISSSPNFQFAGTNSFFNFAWYLTAQVNDTSNAALQDADVSAWDRNNLLWLTVLTDANGLIPKSYLPQYKRNTTGTFQLSNFTLNATKLEYSNQTQSTNMTTHRFVSFTLNETGVNVTYCRTLDTADTTYTLQKNISSAGTCITFAANNITFNGNYNNITYNTGDTDSNYGIYATNVNNTFINNTQVHEATSTSKDSYGIYLLNVINGSLKNSTIRTSGGSGRNTGIVLSGTSSFAIENTSVTTSDATSHALSLTLNSTNNSFKGLVLKTSGTGANALNLAGTNHNFTLKDSILNASGGGSGFFVTGTLNGGNWNFTNVTQANGTVFNKSWASGANGTLNVHWYLDVLANYTNGSLAPNANVSSWNVNNIFQFNVLSGSNGRIAQQILLEYTQNNTGGLNYTSYSNYTINATRPDRLQNLTQSWNMSINRDLVFTFGVIKIENITQAMRASDTTSRTSSIFRVNAQFFTLDNIAARILGALRISNQVLSLNAITARFITYPRSVAQSLILNTATSRTLFGIRSMSQSLILNLATSKNLLGIRGANQSLTLNNVAARSVFLARASSQSLTLNLATSKNLLGIRSIAQSFTLNNIVVRTAFLIKSASQSLTLNLETSRTLLGIRSMNQSLTLNTLILK